MPDKHILAFVAIAATTINILVYSYSILRRKIRPHVFSWFIWGLIMAIGFMAQIAGGAGIGAWPTGYSVLMCFIVTGLSFSYGEKTITRSDWMTFIGALAAIPLWVMTKNPLGAVILVTLIDALGFYPTFRKSYADPWREKIFTFCTSGFIAFTSTLALENYSLVTTLYPVSLVITNWALAAMLLWRRGVVLPL